jgi:hypothetical protein
MHESVNETISEPAGAAPKREGRMQLERIGTHWRVVNRDGHDRTVLSEHASYEQALEAAQRRIPDWQP